MENLTENNLLIFINEVNSRAEYIFSFIFKSILGVNYSFTVDKQEFLDSVLPKINYSGKNDLDGLFLNAHQILFETGIRFQDIDEIEFQNHKFCFRTDNQSFLPFDPFAFAFLVLTRYEEYLPKKTDEHERFSDDENILIKLKIEHKPVIDNIAYFIAEKISAKWPGFKIKSRQFKFLTTIDIDNAWAYKNKSIIVILGSIFRNLSLGNFKELKSRMAVLLGILKDPYDTYDYIIDTYKNNYQNLKFFFLLGNRDNFDKNLSYKNKTFRKLIADLSAICDVGIHPSYASSNKYWLVDIEKQRLEDIIKKQVYASRQHFLKIKFPSTYQQLIKSGISNDFTMGFATTVGFRAGTCTSFSFFDLSLNKCTSLTVNPFQCMDVSLRNYMRLTSNEAREKVLDLMNEVKNVNGTFISLWHNESLQNKGHWEGWNNVFDLIYKKGLEFSEIIHDDYHVNNEGE